jgi:hypothetical protein
LHISTRSAPAVVMLRLGVALVWTVLAAAQFPTLTISLEACGLPGDTPTAILSPPAPAGSSLLVGSYNGGAIPKTVSDDVGSNYTIADSVFMCSTVDYSVLFYALKLNATVTSITFPVTTGVYNVFAMVYTPALTGLVSTAVQRGPLPPGALISPLATNQMELLAIQYVRQGGNLMTVPDPPFLARSTNCGDMWADARLSSPTSFNASFSYPLPSCGWALTVAIFTTSLTSLSFPTGVTSGTLPGSYTIR